ncbi:Probable LRR receptor-like serine/threonine-protein kinase At3g47570 [Linum perenne]
MNMRCLSAFLGVVAAALVQLLSFCSCASGNILLSNETDRAALLQFKSMIDHSSLGSLSSWNDSVHFCEWYGVSCSKRHYGRVTSLGLRSQGISGSISPHIGNLSFLKVLDVRNNSFTGEIPPEIGRLRRLRELWLNNNSLSGEIPSNISRCSNLVKFVAKYNKLVGGLPWQFGILNKLKSFTVKRNNLTGTIPSTFGNLSSSIQYFDVGENQLSGRVPNALGQLKNLQVLDLSFNNLSGEIPASIFNLSSLTDIWFGYNQFHGELPWNIGISLPNLEYLDLIYNHFTGSVPPSLSNASNLVLLQLNDNKLTGSMPDMVRSNKLIKFYIDNNFMGMGSGKAKDLNFLNSLINATSLESLGISGNNFGGSLPQSFGNLSTSLKWLGFDNNKISGSIPNEIQYLVGLVALSAYNNNLSGTIPSSIENLYSLQKLYLDSNKISGYIPFSIGNLTKLIDLDISYNHLHGKIPTSIQKYTNLLILDLSRNNLSGLIPSQVMSLRSLSIALDLSHNQFIGSIPTEVGTLKNLEWLDLSHNMFSGSIPSSMGGCISLEYLYLQGNLLQGIIPSSLSSLKGIRRLDLSANNLSGQIPKFLELMNISQLLNLSFNNFEGEVPRGGAFKNASIISVKGNSRICGGIAELKLPPCHDFTNSKKALSRKWKIVMSTISSLLFLIFIGSCLSIFWIKKRGKQDIVAADDQPLLQLSYQRLFVATNGFSSFNLIGIGSFGSVYKGVLHADGTSTNIAVKVFNLQRRGAFKSFMSECEALKNIRHKNLVRILTVCSSVDHQGNEFKALVYEYLANGSLEDWLHNPIERLDVSTRNLSFIQRMNISTDIASAIDYLHSHCGSSIVHCDLKPSNILLDDDMVAHVGDFGLARFISAIANPSTSSIGVKGTVGYAPPEYGMGNQVSTEGDVYSYGILLLELFTGRRPTEETFKEGLDLHNMVRRALSNQQTMEVVDPILLNELLHHRSRTYRNHNGTNTEETRKSPEELVRSILEIGVACSSNIPDDRIGMSEVVSRLTGIRKFCLVERRIEVNIRT